MIQPQLQGSAPPIFIVGAGGVGLYLAARLSKVAAVTLVRRTLRERARALPYLDIELSGAESGSAQVVWTDWARLSEFPDGAVILLTCKATDLDSVLDAVIPRLPSLGARLILAQNGLDIPSVLRSRSSVNLKWARLVAWFGVKREPEVGFKVRVGGSAGADWAIDDRDLRNQEEWKSFFSLFDRAGISTRMDPSVAAIEWRKAFLNLSVNGLAAIAGVTNGRLLEDPSLGAIVDRLLTESYALAQALQVEVRSLGEERESLRASIARTRLNKNSTLQDLEAGKPTEIGFLNSYVVRKSSELGLEAPTHQLIEAVIRARSERSGS